MIVEAKNTYMNYKFNHSIGSIIISKRIKMRYKSKILDNRAMLSEPILDFLRSKINKK